MKKRKFRSMQQNLHTVSRSINSQAAQIRNSLSEIEKSLNKIASNEDIKNKKEKNKKAGVLGKLKWVLCGFCMLLSLGAIGASEKYIGEGRWGMAATEILLCLLFLYPTFREVQKALRKKKAREIACWFESYAQNTVSFEKLEQELGKGAVKKLEKFIARGYIRNIQIDREGNYIMITAPNRRVNEKIYITVTCTSCGAKNQVIKGRLSNCEYCGQRLNS